MSLELEALDEAYEQGLEDAQLMLQGAPPEGLEASKIDEVFEAPKLAADVLPPTVVGQRLSRDEIRHLEGLADVLVEFLASRSGVIDSQEALSDLATIVMIQLARGQLKVPHSAEMRKWAELIYSMVVVKGDTGVGTYIEQLNVLAQGLPSQ